MKATLTLPCGTVIDLNGKAENITYIIDTLTRSRPVQYTPYFPPIRAPFVQEFPWNITTGDTAPVRWYDTTKPEDSIFTDGMKKHKGKPKK